MAKKKKEPEPKPVRKDPPPAGYCFYCTTPLDGGESFCDDECREYFWYEKGRK